MNACDPVWDAAKVRRIQTLRAFCLAQLRDLEAWRLRGKVAKKLR